jgi:hypothetical protein
MNTQTLTIVLDDSEFLKVKPSQAKESHLVQILCIQMQKWNPKTKSYVHIST